MNKEKKIPIVKPKFYYDIKIECLLPSTITYRVYAEDPQQAAEMISKHQSPIGVKYQLTKRRDLKLLVFDAGCSMLRWMKLYK